MHKKDLKPLANLEILAIVTLERIDDILQIAPALKSTTDLWFECIAQIRSQSRDSSRTHFIVSDDFKRFRGVDWGNGRMPDGTIVAPLHPTTAEIMRNMNPKKTKKQFEEALPTSMLMTQLGH